jgi:hypothetical protein
VWCIPYRPHEVRIRGWKSGTEHHSKFQDLEKRQ